jgi:hypothetical protein
MAKFIPIRSAGANCHDNNEREISDGFMNKKSCTRILVNYLMERVTRRRT